MSSWGMNDGANLTGKHLWTNGDATVQDGGTGPNATYVTDNVQAGDVLVGADSKLYRVVSVTSETALEVDRNYEGGTADGEDILRMKLPRFVKITKDDGTGHTLQTLGIFGVTKGEADAGVDNLSAIGLSGTSSIGRAFQSGTAHRSVPTVTVAAPPTNTIATSKVNTTDNTIEIANHGFRTGTKLTYSDGPGPAITGLTDATAYFVIAKETTDSGTTFGDLTSNTFALASSLSNAQAGTALNLTGTGHSSQTLIGDTATATAVLGSGSTLGEVIRVDIAGVGSAYTSAPTVTIAAPTTETVDMSDGTKIVDGTDEIVVSAGFYGAIKTGDKVTYAAPGTAPNTVPTGFTDDTGFFIIKSANSNKVLIASTRENALEGTNITIATGSASGTAHTLIGETPTATATLGLGTPGTDTGGREIAHVGWGKRTVGTGGRAGRVHYETLVAASSITGDSEDLITPDS